MDKSVIAKVQSFGFDVYMRNENDSYMLFTDGTRIGYLQQERSGGYSISTVHVPNKTTGTGFQVEIHGDDKTKLDAAFMFAPDWASSEDRRSVVKWRDIEHYRASNSFNGGYTRVEPANAAQ